MSPGILVALLVWGTLVGVDLVSLPQMMIARPLVAGTVAGLLLGDLETGLRVGVVLELFQFDVLPVGAARYPEYGPATIAAVTLAHGLGGTAALGIATGVALVLAIAGGFSLHLLRTVNGRAVHRATAALEAGDPRVIARVHASGIARDVLRSIMNTALGLAVAVLGARIGAGRVPQAVLLATTVAACGAALAVGGMGLLRLVGRARLRWLAAGLAAGGILAWLA
jgi:mannose/fructose/N-acetylgalactosamine-specific phosphotransferase system component IIC